MLTYVQSEALMFASYNQKGSKLSGYDQHTRDLSPMRRLLDLADIPLDLAPTVTITGSKGKGSTAILTAALLQGAGHRVGLLTSPHYLSHTERIRLNGSAIPADTFARIATELAPLITALDADLPPVQYLSPTGLFLAVALRYFAESGATALVLEVGRGGRYDDVSLVHNQVSVLTPITEEHLDRLGPGLLDIAWHKSGIIKPQNAVISAHQHPSVENAIKTAVNAQNGRLCRLGEDVLVHHEQVDGGQRVQVRFSGADESLMAQLSTAGLYQTGNLGLAFAAARALDDRPGNFDRMAASVERVRLPGRAERLSQQPTVYVDGAINGASAAQFYQSVLPSSPAPRVLVTALPEDKDHCGLLDQLAPWVDHIIVTQAGAHLRYGGLVVDYARQIHPQVTHQPDVTSALQAGLDAATAQGTLWVAGTQSLVREAMRFWNQDLSTLIIPSD